MLNNNFSLHTAVAEENVNSERKLVYQHRIEKGVTKIDHYGLALAAKTNLPENTVNLAEELADFISRNRQVGRQINKIIN